MIFYENDPTVEVKNLTIIFLNACNVFVAQKELKGKFYTKISDKNI